MNVYTQIGVGLDIVFLDENQLQFIQSIHNLRITADTGIHPVDKKLSSESNQVFDWPKYSFCYSLSPD